MNDIFKELQTGTDKFRDTAGRSSVVVRVTRNIITRVIEEHTSVYSTFTYMQISAVTTMAAALLTVTQFAPSQQLH